MFQSQSVPNQFKITCVDPARDNIDDVTVHKQFQKSEVNTIIIIILLTKLTKLEVTGELHSPLLKSKPLFSYAVYLPEGSAIYATIDTGRVTTLLRVMEISMLFNACLCGN